MPQIFLSPDRHYAQLDSYLLENRITSVFLVCGNSIRRLPVHSFFDTLEQRLGIRVTVFQDFRKNPLYEDALRAVEQFRQQPHGAIIAVGGGSAIDIAKCVKTFHATDAKLLAVPTTAGSGSESTRFAVIYRDGVKQSVTDERCLPDAVMLDPSVLKTLPDYPRKSAMLDALCHAMESWWSVNSTEESRMYSETALREILSNMDACLANEDSGNTGMLRAANTAGKAIHIAQTTAGHAMCYKLTGLYGIAHGHAAALCDAVLLPWTAEHLSQCTDPQKKSRLKSALDGIAHTMGCETPVAAAEKLQLLLRTLRLPTPSVKAQDYSVLCASVNPERLKNHPISLDEAAINQLYHQILHGTQPHS